MSYDIEELLEWDDNDPRWETFDPDNVEGLEIMNERLGIDEIINENGDFVDFIDLDDLEEYAFYSLYDDAG